ncbi:hypothetical protein ACPV5J_17245 [Vibrio rotiferianus]|uniref:hypothetical protein n=1 Tax=Vibrio rotiferianus TaxID=190895 RepID=UPI00406A4159
MNKKNAKSSISENLALTIAKSGSTEFPAEVLEFTIDQALDESLLKDIPFVGWVVKGISTARTITDRIFYHKVLRFLLTLEKVSDSDRQDFLYKIETDHKFQRNVGEHLVVILNKIDSFEKTSLLAKCFDHFISQDIEYSYFMNLSFIIERTPIYDLEALCVPKNKKVTFSNTGIAVSCGILELSIISDSLDGEPKLGTNMSKYGRDLRDIFLGEYRSRLAKEKAQQERFWAIVNSGEK